MNRSVISFYLLYFATVCYSPTQSTAQIFLDDFEGNGSIAAWVGDDCAINTSFSNPFPEGINTSATVLRYSDDGGVFANVRWEAENNFDLSVNYTFSLKLYVPSSGLTGGQPNQVALKLQNGNLEAPWSTQSEIIKPIALDQWQTITFDFANDTYINLDAGSPPPTQRTDFNRVVIQINGENNTDNVLAYLDNFYYDNTVDPGPVYDQLIWSDEFDVDGPVNPDNWFHQTLLPDGQNWFNGEIQHYTDRTDNAVVSDGTLKIIAKKETYTDQGVTKQYTSARLNSKFAFQYGKVVIRAKLPTGVGSWPALWMLGKNINEDGGYWDNEGLGTTSWPACGEIDIMEHWGDNQNYVSSATHTPSSFGGTINVGGQVIPTASTAFHDYELEWTPEKLVFSVDGTVHFTYNPPVKDANTWPFDAEQYFLFNIAIQASIHPSFTASDMEIDYIRVFQASPVATQQVDDPREMIYYPNPVGDTLTIQLENAAGKVLSIQLYTLDGQLIDTYRVPVIDKQLSLNDLGKLTSGFYLLSYELNGEVYSFKILKE